MRHHRGRVIATRRIAALAMAVALAGSATACSSGGSTTTTTTAAGIAVPTARIPAVAKSIGLASSVPAGIAATGQLTVGTAPTSPPGEFRTGGGSLVGVDIDLATAIGQVLGLKATFVTAASRTAVVTAVRHTRVDLGMSSITDTAAAQGPVDFVDYLQSGQGFLVRAGSGRTFAGSEALCGSTVAVQRGTAEQVSAVGQATTCAQAKDPVLRVLVAGDLASVASAVDAGRAQVGLVSSLAADFAVAQSHGKLAIGGPVVASQPLGIVATASGGLSQPVGSALNTLITDGTYAAILAKWGVQSGAIATATINGAH